MPALEGKSAVVTGASSGIGAATAQALAREGARVVGGARRTDRIADPVTAFELDVTDPASCEAFVGRAVKELGGIDILVNAAGLALGRDRSTTAPRKTSGSCWRRTSTGSSG